MALSPGTKLGPYEVLAPIGAGGMGEVYSARDTRLDRRVAVKVLSSHLSSNSAATQRFEREARAISSLNHPNICSLHDVGDQDGTHYLVMEFLEGETLAERLRKGPLPPEQVLKYGVEICDGLEIAHRSGVIHRDLKPGNICYLAYLEPSRGQTIAVRSSIEAPEKQTFSFTGDGGGPPAISPDGTQVVYAAVDSAGKQHLWLRPLNSSISFPNSR